jgi:hypothetical protein
LTAVCCGGWPGAAIALATGGVLVARSGGRFAKVVGVVVAFVGVLGLGRAGFEWWHRDSDYDDTPDRIDCEPSDSSISTEQSEDVDCDGVVNDQDCAPVDANDRKSKRDDADCDSITDDLDCDPNGHVDDLDCDGTLSAVDCDDMSADVKMARTEDGDCDGLADVDDCGPADAKNLVCRASDADCDGAPNAEDCDPNGHVDDVDCDGLAAVEECNDLDGSDAERRSSAEGTSLTCAVTGEAYGEGCCNEPNGAEAAVACSCRGETFAVVQAYDKQIWDPSKSSLFKFDEYNSSHWESLKDKWLYFSGDLESSSDCALLDITGGQGGNYRIAFCDAAYAKRTGRVRGYAKMSVLDPGLINTWIRVSDVKMLPVNDAELEDAAWSVELDARGVAGALTPTVREALKSGEGVGDNLSALRSVNALAASPHMRTTGARYMYRALAAQDVSRSTFDAISGRAEEMARTDVDLDGLADANDCGPKDPSVTTLRSDDLDCDGAANADDCAPKNPKMSSQWDCDQAKEAARPRRSSGGSSGSPGWCSTEIVSNNMTCAGMLRSARQWCGMTGQLCSREGMQEYINTSFGGYRCQPCR